MIDGKEGILSYEYFGLYTSTQMLSCDSEASDNWLTVGTVNEALFGVF